MATDTAGAPSSDRSRPAAAAAARPTRTQIAALARVWLPLLGLWSVLAVALSALMTKVVNWYLMTDELLYERLAISVIEHRSPLPRVHGELLPSLNQLYPVLLAPAFRHDLIIDALFDAHVINAWLMTSTCIPAFLLTRRATGRLWAAYGVALLAVTVPWITYSGFLLTEVAGYPAFAWGVYLIHRTTDEPSRANDWLALAGIALAISARVQFVALLAVPPLAIYAHALAPGARRPLPTRLATAAREAVRAHRTLAVAYAILVVAGLGLLAVGRLSTTLGTYKTTASGNVVPDGVLAGLVEHVATLALGLGLLPFMVAVAWVLASLVRPESRQAHAFASVAAATLAVLFLEVTLFDLRYGGPGWIADRYLFYVAPVVFAAFACALCGTRWPRWSFAAVSGLVVLGFWIGDLPTFHYLHIDTVTAVLYEHAIVWVGSYDGARWLLVVTTVVLSVLYLQGSMLLRHSHLAIALAALALVTLSAETASALNRMFRPNEVGRRMLIYDQSALYAWIDLRAPGRVPDVTMIPYPSRPGDYWTNVGEWWTLEFWNKAIVRSAHYRGEYEWTPSTFSKLYLRFDPETGLANVSPTPLVAQSDKETRFRISGPVQALPREVMLVEAEQPWRTDWLSYGLYADGWTKPRRAARIHVFAYPGQKAPVRRALYLSVMAPFDLERRAFAAVSNIDEWRGTALGKKKTGRVVHVCVPAEGFAEVRVTTPQHSLVYGDQRDGTKLNVERQAGILLTQIALADELLGPCRPGPSAETSS